MSEKRSETLTIVPVERTALAAKSGERRAKGRYPIELELEYKLLKRGRVEWAGVGRTLNISSSGVLVETDRSLLPGALVELSVKWPFLLRGMCALKLVLRGRIVRCHAHSKAAAIKAESREFRTAGVRAVRNERTPVGSTVNPYVLSVPAWEHVHAVAAAACSQR